MTVEQKAKQLALTLVGEDQNPEPLVEVLVEMAAWQKQQMMNDAIGGKITNGVIGENLSINITKLQNILHINNINVGEKVKLIIIKED